MFLFRLRQAGELLLIIVAELIILLGIVGIIISLTASKAKGITFGGSVGLLIPGIVMVVVLQKIPQAKIGRTLAEVRLPFLKKKEHASWWLFDHGEEKAVVCVRHWRSEHFKGTSLGCVFLPENTRLDQEVLGSLADSEQWARYVKEGALVKLADGPRYHRRQRS